MWLKGEEQELQDQEQEEEQDATLPSRLGHALDSPDDPWQWLGEDEAFD